MVVVTSLSLRLFPAFISIDNSAFIPRIHLLLAEVASRFIQISFKQPMLLEEVQVALFSLPQGSQGLSVW